MTSQRIFLNRELRNRYIEERDIDFLKQYVEEELPRDRDWETN